MLAWNDDKLLEQMRPLLNGSTVSVPRWLWCPNWCRCRPYRLHAAKNTVTLTIWKVTHLQTYLLEVLLGKSFTELYAQLRCGWDTLLLTASTFHFDVRYSPLLWRLSAVSDILLKHKVSQSVIQWVLASRNQVRGQIFATLSSET